MAVKRRPTAADRQIADYVMNLPFGEHRVFVQSEGLAHLKPDGGLVVQAGGKTVVFAPEKE